MCQKVSVVSMGKDLFFLVTYAEQWLDPTRYARGRDGRLEYIRQL